MDVVCLRDYTTSINKSHILAEQARIQCVSIAPCNYGMAPGNNPQEYKHVQAGVLYTLVSVHALLMTGEHK